MRMPRGGASCLGVRRPGSCALPPPTAHPLGGLPGPTTHWLWVRGGVGVGTRHQPHSARSCVLWGWHEGARGGRLLPGCGASGIGRSPTPDCPPSGRAAGAHYPHVEGARGCGRGDPSPTPHRALLQAGCARCGSGRRAPGGGACCLGVGRLGRSPTPDCPPSWRAAGAHYPLAVGAGGCGRGHSSPTPQRALLRAGFARFGGGTRAPGGGAYCLGVGRPRLGALPSPTACPLGGLPGPTTHWLWVRGGAGVETRHQSHSARSCVLWGRHEGAREGRLLPGCGASGVGRSPTPDCPPSGRAAGAHYPLVVGAGGCGRGDLSPTPQRALLRAGFARCGGGRRAPGGGASCLCVGRPGSGALPSPTARPLGGLPGPTTHWLWVRGGAGVGTCHRPHSARSCVLWGRHEGARGGHLLPGCGACRVERSPTPDCPPSGPAAGAHYPLVVGAGGCGRGDPSPTPQRALLQAGSARCGGRIRVPGRGASCQGVGRPGSGALPPPTARPVGGLPGPTTHRLWMRGGAGVGTRHQPHIARSCELAVRAVGAARGDPGGGLLPWCGASGVRRSPTPDCPPSGGAAEAHYPLALGAGGCGRGGPSPTPQRALLRAGFAHCGGGTRAPARGASCLGVGRRASGALPPPTAHPLGGLPGPTTHWLWVRGGAGVGTCHQPHSARSPGLWGRHEGAWGGRFLPGCVVSGVGRSPTPDCPPSGRAAGAHYPLAMGVGGCGRGSKKKCFSFALRHTLVVLEVH